jgi:amino acid adenylation domain-containing protein
MNIRLSSDATRKMFPLSLAQRGIWLGARQNDDPSAFIIGNVATFRSEIDPDIARRALRLVMSHHDGLRLRVDRDEPRQWIEPAGPPPFEVVDFSDAEAAEAAAGDYVAAERQQGFSLGDQPLFRIRLLRLGHAHWQLVMLVHHLIGDGVSIALAQDYWLKSYKSLAGDIDDDSDEDGLRIPASSYIPVAEGDAAYESSITYAEEMAYWRGRLADLPPPLLDGRPAPLPTTLSPADGEPRISFSLDIEGFSQLQEAARQAGTTPHRALMGVFAVALSRRYRRTDFVLGMALHRREWSTRHVIGMVAGVLPLRCRIDNTLTLMDAVKALAADFEPDFRRHRLPVDALARGLASDGAFAGRIDRTLFDVAVTMIPPFGDSPSSLGGQPIVSRPIRANEASPLTIYVDEHINCQGLTVSFGFHANVLSFAEVTRLRDVLAELVEAFCTQRDQRLSSFEGLGLGEAAQLSVFAAGTDYGVPDSTLPELFEAQARLQPQALAVIADGDALTYEALDKAANRIAHRLRDAGAAAGTAIGVLLPRSRDSIVSILGILKAGCVYVPLDPAYPDPRLMGMIEDAGVALIVTAPDLEPRMPKTLQTVLIFDPSRLDEDGSAALTREALGPDSRAYIIYTSGSRGRPKGVAVAHGALVNLAYARLEHDPIGPGDRVLAAISVGFDVSIGQLFTPLLSGATVVVAGDIRGASSDAFWDFIVRHGVTHVNSVPSFFETVLDGAPSKTALKQIMLGGEPLSRLTAQRLRDRLGVKVFNMYGPTEACIDATAYRVADEAVPSTLAVPIGRPLPNYQCHVLDKDLSPIGMGAVGELCIGGPSLAQGYINMPDATSERFIVHPRLGRLYRTGDQVYWRDDGQLVFLGRSDGQVKIRGFRVETGEVEAVIREHAGVAQAAVIARKDHHNELRLLGYIVPSSPEPLTDLTEVSDFLSKRLPAHMVPAALIIVDRLPLTTNGKLDERALPDPQITVSQGQRPSTPTEILLAEHFAALLGVTEVDTASHFFELGGHSLLATQLASRLRETLGLELPIRTLFEAPRLGELAHRIETLIERAEAGDNAETSPIVAAVRPDQLPLSFEQERLWFLHKLDPQSPAYNIPTAFHLDGQLDLDAITAAFAALARRHEVLRTRFHDAGGVPKCTVRQDMDVPIAIEDLGGEDPQALFARVREEALKPFDLTRDPLIRVLLLRTSETSHVALVTLHHIVSDGWSVSILQAEIAAHYIAARTGCPVPLPALNVQYADYALWQRQRLGKDEIAGRVAFWKAELAGAPEILALPLDRQRPARRKDAGGATPIELSPELSARIRAFAHARGTTPFVIFAAAWAALMARRSGQEEVVVGAPIANRGRSETEGLIGFFVNTIALRADLADQAGFGQLVDRMRDRALNIFQHADLPFDQIVDALNPARSPGVHPLFQTVIAYQTAPTKVFAFSDIQASAIPLPESVAKFDLTLVVNETPGVFEANIVYALDLFDPDTIASLSDQFHRLMHSALADPAQPIMALRLTSDLERQALIDGSLGTPIDANIDTIPALFERRVGLHPDIEAVRHGSVSISFADLNRQANRLAHALISRGVVTGQPVAVVIGRSQALVVVALGIMKAGGVYMPIDPAHPRERITDMLSRAAPAAVLVDDTSGDIAKGAPWPVLHLSSDEFDRAREDNPGQGDRLGPLDATSIAYIIHTSGSTGHPKGVAVSHGALANLAEARRRGHDPIGLGDRVLATLSVSFDVSVGQLVTPLLAGATVVVASDAAAMTGAEFWALIKREGVTHLNSGPAFLDALLDTPPPALPLKRLMLGGEAFPTALAKKISAAIPDLEIFNMYGPTEACIDATAYRYRGTETSSTLPIGRALPNYRVVVLDVAMDPVPRGIPGEIYIGGKSLAREYVGMPDETAERFVPNPFGASGERLYRTGDLGRVNAAGDIEFLGRADSQVKIRGFRIELEEVAAALQTHPDIRTAKVISLNTQAENRLVAYAVPKDNAKAITGWRQHLQTLLPSHMIPSALVAVAVLPITVNGKLDLRALPAPDFGDNGRPPLAPARDALDESLIGIWSSLLDTSEIGIDDNFFQIGGHSLQALRLVAACKANLGIDIPIAAIYRHQTIRLLADAIRSGKAFQTGEPLVKLGDGVGRPVFCFHPVGGAAFSYMGLADALAGQRPVYGVQASGLDAGEAVAESLDEMAVSYLTAIRETQPAGPYALIGHSFGGLIAFEIASRLEAMGETVDRLVMIDTSHPGEPWTMDRAESTASRIVNLERDRSGSKSPIDPAQLTRVTAIVANNMRLSESYTPPIIESPLSYLLVSRGDLPPNGRREFWESKSSQPVIHEPWPVDHWEVLNRENAPTLARLFI